MMRAHCLQHVPFEGPGSIEPWLATAGYTLSYTRFHETAQLPALPRPETIDFLIVLGGPMGVHDERLFPWLVAEKRFIEQTITRGVPVLGICLGAQLIAHVMGARVYRHRFPEIGWFPVYPVTPQRSGFPLTEVTTAFHWHGDTFDLPAGSVHLARSDACENQAFLAGEAVLGLQFHLETIPESARALVVNCSDELTPSPHVQSESEILDASAARYQAINRIMEDVLSFLVRRGQAGTQIAGTSVE